MTTPSTYKLGYPPLKYSTAPAISMDRAPTTSDVYHPTAGGVFPVPTIWSDKSGDNAYVLTSVSSGPVANWEIITSSGSGFVVGPASSTDNALARFDSTTGELIQNSGVTLDDDDVMLYPAEAGPVLTSGGTNPRKGQVTLVGGTATVATTAALADSVICLTIVTLGTVTDPMPMLVTIDPGVDFDITSEDATDTSVINWAIVA